MMAEIPGFGGSGCVWPRLFGAFTLMVVSDQVQTVPSQMFGNPSPVFRRPNGAL